MSRPASRFTGVIASPFPGLRPFQPHEWPVFFGRREHVADMLTVLEDHRFLVVVGPSGGGKSSLVLAGLLPALERGGLLTERSDDWRFVTLRPGDAPFHSLATALQQHLPPVKSATSNTEDLAKKSFHDGDVHLTEMVLRDSPRGFLETLRDAAVPERANVLLLVDQFEEIFRFRTPEQLGTPGQAADRRNEAADFVRLLLATFQQSERPVYVMLTMRSDFLGECDLFDELPQAINRGQYLTARLNARQLAEAITEPPRLPQFGGAVEPDVVRRILNDIGTARDELPVVQHALACAWNTAVARDSAAPGAARVTLTLSDYRDVGGIQEALSREADHACSDCSQMGLERTVERIFRGLVQRGPNGQHVRRPRTIRQLSEEADALPEQVISVVEAFRRTDRSFLVSSPPNVEKVALDTPIDISHESLIRQWKKLRNEWLTKEDDDAEKYVRLVKAEASYRRREADLLSGLEVERLHDWWEREQPKSLWARRYEPNVESVQNESAYILASRYLNDSWRAHSRRRIAFWSSVAASLVLVFAIVPGAWWQWNRYQDRRANEGVEAVLNAAPDQVRGKIQAVDTVRSRTIPLFRQTLLDPAQSAQHRLHAALALGLLGEVPYEFLLGAIAAGPNGQVDNLAAVLRPVAQTALPKIEQRFAAATSPDERARLAIVALHLGDDSSAKTLAALGPDPTGRTAFIRMFADWHGNLAELAGDIDRLGLTHEPELLSALCLGVGSVASTDRSSADLAAWKPGFETWFQTHPNSAVHSAAGWAMRQWSVPEPPIPRRDSPQEGSDWFVTKSALTLIRIPAGEFVRQDEVDPTAKPQTVFLNRGLWLSDREITVKLFRQFAEDLAKHPDDVLNDWEVEERFGESDPLLDHPVQQVTWKHAVKFCNWLSRREYGDAAICYRRVNPGAGTRPTFGDWEPVPEATGYRLPTEAEWEYACRARAALEYRFSFGNEDELLGDYGWYEANSKNRTRPVGTKKPNGWGLHDVHGNVWEWCQDRYGEYGEAEVVTNPTGSSTGVHRVVRGGSWGNSAKDCRSSNRIGDEPLFRHVHFGFRVARSSSGPASSPSAAEPPSE